MNIIVKGLSYGKKKKNLKIIKCLLNNGTKINTSNSACISPFNILCKKKSEDILEIID